ncbi:MAG: sensor histidine kinase [Spirochaetota bacterium]
MDQDEVRREAERRYRNEHGAGSLEELRIHQIELEIQNEELRRAQQEADEARRRYYALYEYAPVGYITVRPDGKILSANLAICELSGRDRDSVLREGVFGLVHGDDGPAMIHLLKHLASVTDERVSAELRLATNEPKVVRVEAVRRDGRGNAPQEIQLCFTDITRQKEAEERAREAAEHNHLLLRELNHRVKNNLQLLLSLVMLQRNRSSDEATVQALSAVEDRVRAVSFSHETLKSGATSGGADLVELLATLVRQFRAQHGISIDFSATLDHLVVDGDAALSLALVANELVANALKHAFGASADGSIVVRLEVSGNGAGEKRPVRLHVTDSGPGLPPDLLAEERAGSGLGFMLVRQLAEQQLGGTWIRRNHPEGGAEHVVEVDV